MSARKIWYFDHIITVDCVSVQCYEAQQDYNNVSLSFKAWWSHHSLSIATGTELKHIKCVQMLDWHHKHSPSPHTVCLISLNQEESVQHVAFSAWWCQSFQGFSGSLYKRVCSEEETVRRETNAVPMEIHNVPFSLNYLAWLQHHAVRLKAKCVIVVPLAAPHRVTKI